LEPRELSCAALVFSGFCNPQKSEEFFASIADALVSAPDWSQFPISFSADERSFRDDCKICSDTSRDEHRQLLKLDRLVQQEAGFYARLSHEDKLTTAAKRRREVIAKMLRSVYSTFNMTTLRELRKTLKKTQKEMGALVDCSQHMICSIEIGRLPLSTRLASRISQSTEIDLTWLTNGDSTAPMIDHAGRPYSYQTFERRKTNRPAPDESHYRWRELQLGVGFDHLHRILAASRVKGTTKEFMDRVEGFIKTELSHHVRLEDAIFGERRRASQAASKSGRIIALGLLTPFDEKPFRRGRERLGQAIAAFTARRVKSKK
jgi:transcriptional regulator with XRE-family HTH domain